MERLGEKGTKEEKMEVEGDHRVTLQVKNWCSSDNGTNPLRILKGYRCWCRIKRLSKMANGGGKSLECRGRGVERKTRVR